VSWGSPQQSEVYGYDENGRRIAKAQVSGGTSTLTFYPFAFYEQRGRALCPCPIHFVTYVSCRSAS